jgi:hypothetical protein
MNSKAHLTLPPALAKLEAGRLGLKQIVNIKASMNLGLSDMLKSEFKGYSPVERPVINSTKGKYSPFVRGPILDCRFCKW